MPIRVACPGCGTELNVPDEMGGKRGKCPKCGQVMAIPQVAPAVQPVAPPPPPTAQAPPPPPSAYGPPPRAAYGPPVPPSGAVSDKSQSTAFLLAALLGWVGADRFYLGYTGLGILKLLTCGGCGIWALIDAVVTGIGKRKDANGCQLREDPPVGRPQRSRTTAFILSWLLGVYGVDRFYLGYTGLGILKLITCGGCGVWAIIDYFMIGMGTMKDADGNSLLND